MMQWEHYVTPEIKNSLRHGEKEILDALEVHVDFPLRLRGENDREYIERWVNSGVGVIADWEIDIIRKALKLTVEVSMTQTKENDDDRAQRDFMMSL